MIQPICSRAVLIELGGNTYPTERVIQTSCLTFQRGGTEHAHVHQQHTHLLDTH